MKRRSVLKLGVVTTLSLSVGAACKPVVRTDEVLRQLVRQVVAPNLDAVVRDCAALAQLLERAHALSDVQARAERGLIECMLSFERASALRKGALHETNAMMRGAYFPMRAKALAVLAEQPEPQLAKAGVDAKGVYALEALLFPGAEDPWRAMEPGHKLRLVTALAGELRALTQSAKQAFGDGKILADTFATHTQLALGSVVQDMLFMLETIVAKRLLLLVPQKGERPSVAELRGARSGLSARLPAVLLGELAQVYGDGERGLSRLVSQASSSAHTRLRTQLERARAAMSALRHPLDDLALNPPALLEAAIGAIRGVELAIKTDLVGTLSIPLSFTSIDGD